MPQVSRESPSSRIGCSFRPPTLGKPSDAAWIASPVLEWPKPAVASQRRLENMPLSCSGLPLSREIPYLEGGLGLDLTLYCMLGIFTASRQCENKLINNLARCRGPTKCTQSKQLVLGEYFCLVFAQSRLPATFESLVQSWILHRAEKCVTLLVKYSTFPVLKTFQHISNFRQLCAHVETVNLKALK